jgi:hypothetical protein
MTAPPMRDLARVLARDGRTVLLPDGGSVVLGRDPGCDLAFPEESRLSRRAVQLESSAAGVLITNLSTTHGLVIDADGAVSRLPAAPTTGATGGVVTRGRAELSGPAWGASTFGVTVVVDTPPVAVPVPDGVVNSTVTSEPLRLRTQTKEFVTALMLCRRRLLDATDTAPPPQVPELTRLVLEATNSWHLVHELETDERTRSRLTGRVHEHLKALRVKIVRSGLAERGARLSPGEMVELLVAAGTVTRQHLNLLEDPAWLAHQEQQWWGA